MSPRVLPAAFVLAGCAAQPSQLAPSPSVTTSPGAFVGRVTREQIESSLPAWRTARDAAAPDAVAARSLVAVAPGATVRVFLGTWCGDSRREVARLWKALDVAGTAPPFALELVGVDRAKRSPGGLTDGADVRFVPTFVVLREGREVGRVIESAPGGIESDLGALLEGVCRGTVSRRTDVGAVPCAR